MVVRSVLLALALSLVAGCASGGARWADEARAMQTIPDDFSLSATVFAPASWDTDRNVPRYRRPTRLVLEPDRVLRAAVGPGVSEETYPANTRRLTQEQVADIWNLLRGSPLLEPDRADLIGTGTADRPGEGESSYVISYRVLGVRRTVKLAGDGSGAGSIEAQRLVDKLCELAWIE